VVDCLVLVELGIRRLAGLEWEFKGRGDSSRPSAHPGLHGCVTSLPLRDTMAATKRLLSPGPSKIETSHRSMDDSFSPLREGSLLARGRKMAMSAFEIQDQR
jgi:hypothetical protein